MKKRSINIIIFLFVGIAVLFGYFCLKQKLEETGSRQAIKEQSTSEAGSRQVAEEQNIPEAVDAPVYNDDGSVTLPEGYIANGFYDTETNKIIDNKTVIRIPGDTLQGRISFQQNFSEEKNYMLVILIDYMQHEFCAENQKYQNYSFKLIGEDEFNLDISVDLAKDEGKEFSYIIFENEPEENLYLIDGEYNWDVMFNTQHFVTGRFDLERASGQFHEEPEDEPVYTEFQTEGYRFGFELVKNREELMPVVEGKGGQKAELVMMNQEKDSEKRSYVIMGFADWNQVPVDGIHLKYYTTVPANTSLSIPVTFPEVKKPTVFQIVAFGDPDTEFNGEMQRNELITFRVLVKP